MALESPEWVDVSRHSLVLPRLDMAFHGYRLVQISDFHLGGWLTGDRLQALIPFINQLEADLIAITGDFISTFTRGFEADLSRALLALNAHDGIAAVLGNHDHWNDPETVRTVLHDCNVHELNNRVLTLQRGHAQLHIAGVDSYLGHKSQLNAVLKALPETGAAILLAHEPDFADISARSGRFDLQLSGHSHGGQICPPLVGPLFLPRFARKYPRGQYQVNGMTLYTNRGLGRVHLQLRWNCPAEISVLTLEKP